MGSGTNVGLNRYITGRKGASGGGSQPVRTPDNLRSKDTVEVVLAIGEGPMFGLENGAKSFNVGETPLQNANGEYNFKTFQLNVHQGNDVEAPVVFALGGQSSNQPVNVSLATNTPVTRQSVVTNINFLQVRLNISRLMKATSDGTFNHTVTFRIEYKASSSGTWIKLYGEDIAITGKTSGTYAKEFKFAVPKILDTYDIRVTKLTAENTEELISDIAWESFQEIISDENSYNNTCLAHLVVEASDQFTSIPQFSGEYKGMIVKVPSNYNPTTKTYSGAWDGSWQLAWTDNPAWCLYDYVMNERYGIKNYYASIEFDKYDVYEAAKWCDTMVPDGKGGQHARYTLNMVIAEPRSGKELARYMAGCFNATFFDDLNSRAFLRVDKDDDAAHIFTAECISSDGFEYSYTDITSRVNDITVTFINPALNWKEDRRRVFNQNLIDKYGRIPEDFIAVGCINEQEALRRAWLRLITATTETCIVRFTTHRRGQMVHPFDVILICDEDMGYGISGRIKSISEDMRTIELRDPIYLEIGVIYFVIIELKDGSKFKAQIANQVPGYNYTLEFDGDLPNNIPTNGVFTLEADGVIGLPRPFRVMKVEELDGSPDAFTIEAVSINRNKWYDSDNITDSGVIQYSALPNPFNPPGPISCGFDERFIKNKRQFQIVVSPEFNRGAYKYYSNDHLFEVWSRPLYSSEPFVKREVLFGDTLVDHPAGDYEFKILGRSYIGYTTRLDDAPVYIFSVTNPKEPPKNIDWIKINKREVYWGYSDPPDDFQGFVIRYHNQAGRTTWDDAAQPHQGVISATSFYTQLIPASARVIMVRAVDYFGILSEQAAYIYRDLGDVSAYNLTEDFQFHPTFPGTKTGCAVESGALKATDPGALMYSGTPTALMYDGGDMYESVYTDMEYEAQFTSTTEGELIVLLDFEGSGYEMFIKEQSESIYRPVPDRVLTPPGAYDIKIKIYGGTERGVINEMTVIIDAEDVEEIVEDINIAPGGTRIPLTASFSVIKIVSVIIQDNGGSATAVGYRVIDKDPVLGPMVEAYDASGTAVNALVDVTIKGHA